MEGSIIDRYSFMNFVASNWNDKDKDRDKSVHV